VSAGINCIVQETTAKGERLGPPNAPRLDSRSSSFSHSPNLIRVNTGAAAAMAKRGCCTTTKRGGVGGESAAATGLKTVCNVYLVLMLGACCLVDGEEVRVAFGDMEPGTCWVEGLL